MQTGEKPYVSAAGRDWLLPLYDPFTKLLGVGASHRRLIDQAAISPGHRILEIGCGTGNSAILVKLLNPGAEIVGIDPDPKALARARRKTQRAGVTVQFDLGYSEELPYPDASFDKVLSAFMFHHLQPAAKSLALRQVRRVLKPGGSLHLVDFAEGKHPSGRLLAGLFRTRLESRFHHSVLVLMEEAGFPDSREVVHRAVILGRLAFYAASLPASSMPTVV
jgi:ubiquinone/menaquinone biosynthesis C-methylase UbiE